MKKIIQTLLVFTFVLTIISCKKNNTETLTNGVKYTFFYSAWSSCLNGVETRAYTSSPIGGTPPADSISRSCNVNTNCTFIYSSWSPCSNGTQNRTYTTSPSGCNGTPPVDSLTRICGTVYTFSYGTWSSCTNGVQIRTYTSNPSGGTPPTDSTTRACYNNFKINSVTLNAFPSVDNSGATWDPIVNTDPDIFFNIDSVTTNIYYGGASYLSNIKASNLPISWPSLASPQIINNFSTTYYISLFDSDFSSFGDPDDPMGKIPFIMNDYITGYPSSFQITNGTSTVTINGTWY